MSEIHPLRCPTCGEWGLKSVKRIATCVHCGTEYPTLESYCRRAYPK